MEKLIVKGVPVYTSDEMKEQLKELIKKYGKPVSKKLMIQLVDDGMLIPITNEASKIKQLIMKIRRQQPLIGINGITENGIAYVIFSDKMSHKMIVKTSLHEIIHVAHMQSPNKFHKINLPLYIKFYSYYYKELFEAKSYDKELFNKFIKKLIKDSYGGYTHYSTYYVILESAFIKHTTLPKQQLQNRVDLIVDLIHKMSNSDYTPHYNIAAALLRKTYRHLFKGMDYTTGVGQELWSPGEIIAVLSTINSDHPNVIKSLKLIQPGKKPELKNVIKRLIK